MRGTQRHVSGPLDEVLRPYRHLAIRVLARAFMDLSNPAGSATDRESARVFLAGSCMLVHWCRVAALDPWCIANYAEKLAAGVRPVPIPWFADGGAAEAPHPASCEWTSKQRVGRGRRVPLVH